jgi:hypothetical protein
MQIDFHHAVTYVVARLAGFGHRDAEIVAYCAQYVDDAINGGLVQFENGAMYRRTASAHKALDYKHFDKLENRHVWLPFHFLPGNGGKRAGENPSDRFIDKIVCRPDSPVAQEMTRSCILGRDAQYGLHRLGVTMHVYADTWAHQGFAGVIHEVNRIQALDDQDAPEAGWVSRMADFFGDQFDRKISNFAGGVLPLGHGAALSYPDRPFLKWRYRSHQGEIVERDNPTDFLAAADCMCRAMQRYRVGDPDADVPGLPEQDRQRIGTLLRGIVDTDGEQRHKQWLGYISRGHFSFPAVRLDYRDKGVGSWKHQAMGTRRIYDKRGERHPFDPSFLSSDWKMFHDAVQAHRFTLLHDILPHYGICAA